MTDNNRNDDDKVIYNVWFFIRLTLFITVVAGLTLNNIYGFAIINTKVECIDDVFLNFTEDINSYLKVETVLKKTFLIASGLFADCFVLIFAYNWITRSKTLRIFYSVITLVVLKLMCYILFLQSGPDNNLNEYPGFPSIINNYNQTGYFFSFEIGLIMLFSLEFREMGKNIYFYIGLSVILMMGFLKLSMRINYIIDIVFAALFAHFIFKEWVKYSPKLDDVFLRNPEKIETDSKVY
jgi:hypothetical protein